MVWILIILLLIGGATALWWTLISRVGTEIRDRSSAQLELAHELKATRIELLRRLAKAVLGYCPSGELEVIRNELATSQEKFNSEHGRLTITKAEIDAVTQRLNDLNETDKELKTSLAEADQEYLSLQEQEAEFKAQNAALQESLSGVLDKIAKIKSELKDITDAGSNLDRAAKDLTEAEGRFHFYEGELAQLNEKYINLKKAYDALDIEYAQLYERHNR